MVEAGTRAGLEAWGDPVGRSGGRRPWPGLGRGGVAVRRRLGPEVAGSGDREERGPREGRAFLGDTIYGREVRGAEPSSPLRVCAPLERPLPCQDLAFSLNPWKLWQASRQRLASRVQKSELGLP